jgi:preprotein translocase subunit SecG
VEEAGVSQRHEAQTQPRVGRASSLSRLYRRHHRLVWLTVALNVAFMLSFTLLVTPFRGPDEPAHFDMVHQYERNPLLRQPNRGIKEVVIGAPIGRSGHPLPVAQRKRLQAAAAAPRSNRPTLSEIGKPKSALPEQMTQHPPLYYLVVAAVTRVVTIPNSFWSWDRELYLMRLLSVLFLAPLALLASEGALALKLSRPAGAIAAGFTLLIPQKSFLGAVVNNDSLTILLAAAVVVAGLRYLAGGSARNAWAGAAAGAALALTKATGAVAVAWVALVIAYTAYERWKRGDRADARRALVPSALLLAVGSIWYIANLIQFHRPQPHPPKAKVVDPVRSSLRQFLPRFFDFISKTFWGQPARRLGIQLPWQIAHALSLLTIAAIVVAFVVAKPMRRYLVALLILCVAQGYLLLQTTWLGNRTHVRGTNFYTGLQGRYLFPLIVPLAVFFAVACAGIAERFSRRVVVQVAAVVVAIGFLLHWAVWVMMLDGYWQAPAVSWSQHLRAVAAWSPLPQVITIIVLFSPLIVLAYALVRGATLLWSRRNTKPTVPIAAAA